MYTCTFYCKLYVLRSFRNFYIKQGRFIDSCRLSDTLEELLNKYNLKRVSGCTKLLLN